MRFLLIPLIVLLCSAGTYKFFTGDEPEVVNHYYFNFQSQGQALKMAYIYKKPIVPNGKTVVLLHGKNFNSDYWLPTIAYLNSKGYAVIAPDQISFGRSSQPLSYQFSFQQFAQNTKQLLDSLQIPKAIVVGHSMGGMLAVRFGLMYPERCSKLILEDPLGLEDWKLLVPYSGIDEEEKKELTKTPEDLKEYMTKNYFHDTWKEEYNSLLNPEDRLLKGKSLAVYAKNAALTSDMIFTQPVCYEFRNLQVPVALIIGQLDRTAIGKDRVSPEISKTLGNYPLLGKKATASFKVCQLIELAGIGHIPHVEDFKLFCKTMDRALR